MFDKQKGASNLAFIGGKSARGGILQLAPPLKKGFLKVALKFREKYHGI